MRVFPSGHSWLPSYQPFNPNQKLWKLQDGDTGGAYIYQFLGKIIPAIRIILNFLSVIYVSGNTDEFYTLMNAKTFLSHFWVCTYSYNCCT